MPLEQILETVEFEKKNEKLNVNGYEINIDYPSKTVAITHAHFQCEPRTVSMRFSVFRKIAEQTLRVLTKDV